MSGKNSFINLESLISHLNSICLKFTPNSSFQDYYAALVCGKSISAQDIRIISLKRLGVYHMMVVSGAHLIFISLIFEKLLQKKLSFFWNSSFLALYIITTGGQPPALRSFFAIFTEDIQKKRKWFWNKGEVIFISLLLSLTISPSWLNSYSLLLSYSASLSLSLFGKLSLLKKSLFIYLFMYAFLLPLSPPHPLSMLSNLFLSPMIGLTLFPLCLLSFIFPPAVFITDYLWNIFFIISNSLAPSLPLQETFDPGRIPLWIIALIANAFLIFKQKRFLHDP